MMTAPKRHGVKDDGAVLNLGNLMLNLCINALKQLIRLGDWLNTTRARPQCACNAPAVRGDKQIDKLLN
ncbi:hypothetical protein E8K88_12295 [Lampropedia aestuarii]|uniref:Uncharacterized protein n=1 Tax=Lampropedia aestuarii TaxID=2562762 RepID=A0A4S5BJW2_9BURK|nr:hypothetical protein [Lampropedia aestuarii]THJ32469.1 hypothetical protein E8K88_12295 [Lampropedia aestuarii]